MAEATNYTLNQWQALNVFAGDGTVPIDNNASEREMKRIVLNRNYVHLQIMCSVQIAKIAGIHLDAIVEWHALRETEAQPRT